MTKYDISDPRDQYLCDKAFYYNAWLLFGKNNPNKVEKFKIFFEDQVQLVSTIPFGETGRYTSGKMTGICKIMSEESYSNLLIEMLGFKNAPAEKYSWLLHEFCHEFCHAFSYLVPQIFSKFPDGIIINDDAEGNIKCNNAMGLIKERDPYTGKSVGTNYYGKMVTETMTDILTTASLVAYEPDFAQNEITIDTVFEKHYDNWNDVQSGYSIFTSITRLLIAAFSNNGYVKYQDLINSDNGILNVETITQNGELLKANDLLYGIMFGSLHTQNEFDKFMWSGAYRSILQLLDQVFFDFMEKQQLSPNSIEKIKIVMDCVPDFLNKKCQHYLSSGMYTAEQTDRIISKFNLIWNSLQNEYGAYFTQNDIDDIAKRAGVK